MHFIKFLLLVKYFYRKRKKKKKKREAVPDYEDDEKRLRKAKEEVCEIITQDKMLSFSTRMHVRLVIRRLRV